MLKRSFLLGPVLVFTFTSLISLAGCSSGDDDSNGSAGSGSGAAPATGGTGASGGSGGSGTGGSGPSAGSGNSGAGTGSMQAFPTLPDCDAVKALTVGPAACAQLGCHKGPYSEAKLDLTPNAGFVGRVKDVAATHLNIDCADGMECATPPAACPKGDKLIDSANVDNSWMLHKLNGTQTGCGDAMPPPDYAIDDAGKACIVELVKAIAAQK
jgi:hypothetical protein